MDKDTLFSLLQKRKVSQSWLAKAVGVDRASVCFWIKGKRTPSLKNVIKIAEALGTSEYEIIQAIKNTKKQLEE